MGTLGKVQDAFKLLAQSCEMELSCLRMRLRHGVNSLPDEVLQQIFELVVENNNRIYSEKNIPVHGNAYCYDYHYGVLDLTYPEVDISYVNRRFRRIALASTGMWSHVSTLMSNAWIRLRLRRSGSHGLIVRIINTDQLSSNVIG